MSTTFDYGVAIIGTGWSGLSAARVLQAKGKKTIDGIVDVGYSLIHGYDKGNPAREIAEALGAEVKVMQGTMPRIISHGKSTKAFDAGAVVAEAAKAGAGGIDLSQVDRASVPSDKSLYDHFAAHSPPQDALAFLRPNELGFGIPLETISLKYWKYERNFAGVDAAPVHGYASLVYELWRSLEDATTNPVKVILSAEVTALEYLVAAGAVKVTTRRYIDSAYHYTVPIVLSTIPLGVLKEKVTTPFFSPSLPQSTLSALSRSKSGDFNKIYISLPKVWWPGGEDKFVFLGPFTPIPPVEKLKRPAEIWAHTTLIVENVVSSISSRALPNHKAILLFMVGGNAVRALEKFKDGEIKLSLHYLLLRKLGGGVGITALMPTSILVTRWRADRYARGAASTPVTVDNNGPLDFIELSRSVWDDHLFFAGEHTEMNHHGSVLGAVLSGEREAGKILTALKARR